MYDQKKTTPTARTLGVPVYALLNWIRHGVIPSPRKDSSGHFLWSPEDVEAARAAAARRVRRRETATD